MPLASIHRELQQIGYEGYYTIDLFNITDDPQKYALASLRACRRLLEQE